MNLTKILMAIVIASIGYVADSFAQEKISSDMIHGKINGKEWTAVMAKKRSIQPTKPLVAVTIYADRDDSAKSQLSDLIVYIPKSIGKYDLESERLSITFFTPPGQNNVGTKGRLEVYEITEEVAKIGITAKFDEQNYVNGTMEIFLKGK